jgi:hypothetical protein
MHEQSPPWHSSEQVPLKHAAVQVDPGKHVMAHDEPVQLSSQLIPAEHSALQPAVQAIAQSLLEQSLTHMLPLLHAAAQALGVHALLPGPASPPSAAWSSCPTDQS